MRGATVECNSRTVVAWRGTPAAAWVAPLFCMGRPTTTCRNLRPASVSTAATWDAATGSVNEAHPPVRADPSQPWWEERAKGSPLLACVVSVDPR